LRTQGPTREYARAQACPEHSNSFRIWTTRGDLPCTKKYTASKFLAKSFWVSATQVSMCSFAQRFLSQGDTFHNAYSSRYAHAQACSQLQNCSISFRIWTTRGDLPCTKKYTVVRFLASITLGFRNASFYVSFVQRSE
jgi:hypothetical protein